MSTVVVTSVLNSIIETEGNSLREMEIQNIKHAKSADPSYRKFLAKFDNLLFGNKNCSSCEEANANDEERPIHPRSMTCFECFRHTCDGCDDNNPDPETWIHTCDHCALTFCNHHGTECYRCQDTFHCQDCTGNVDVSTAQSCDRCNYSFCIECSIRNAGSGCENCDGFHFPALAKKYKEKEKENKQLREEIEELRKKMSSGLGILS